MELYDIKQWLLWDVVGGRKIPRDRVGNVSASNRYQDFMTYSEAMEAEQRLPVMGVAFVFTPEDPYGGIDLDNCLDEEGALKGWAQPIVQACAYTYMETSPSLRGIKIFGRFTKSPGWACRASLGDGGIEIYDRGRFFTFTGMRYAWHTPPGPPRILDLQDQIKAIYGRYFPAAQTSVSEPPKFVPASGRDLVQFASHYIAAVGDPGSGARNTQLFKLAGHLWSIRDGEQRLSEDQVLDLLRAWNLCLEKPRSEEELVRTAFSALRNGTPRPLKYVSPPTEVPEELREWLGRVRAERAAAEDVTEEKALEEQPEASPEGFIRLERVIDDWSLRYATGERPDRLPTGISSIVIERGKVHLFGGGPGSGKTTLTMQMVLSILKQRADMTAMVCNCEIEPPESWVRLLAAEAGVDYEMLRHMEPGLKAHEEALMAARDRLRAQVGNRLMYLEPPYDVKHLAEACGKVQPDIVVLDYVQRIYQDAQHRQDLVIEMGLMSDTMRLMAQGGITVVAVSSLNRDKAHDSYKRPQITSFRGSSELEYGPDEAWQIVGQKGGATLHNVKSRYRENGEKLELIRDKTMRFSEPPKTVEWDY